MQPVTDHAGKLPDVSFALMEQARNPARCLAEKDHQNAPYTPHKDMPAPFFDDQKFTFDNFFLPHRIFLKPFCGGHPTAFSISLQINSDQYKMRLILINNNQPSSTVTTSRATRPESISTLYADHHPWLRAWLRKKLGCVDQAADLAQDTFLRVLSSQEPPPLLNEPRAFLTTIAQRVLSNHWRRQKLEQAYLEALKLTPHEVELSPEERTILLESLIELDKLLDGLPPVVKRAFLLTQLDGLSHAETAETLGISVRTVKRHIVKAGHQCYFSDALN